MKCGSFKLLEPPGLVKASNVMALPVTDAVYTVRSGT